MQCLPQHSSINILQPVSTAKKKLGYTLGNQGCSGCSTGFNHSWISPKLYLRKSGLQWLLNRFQPKKKLGYTFENQGCSGCSTGFNQKKFDDVDHHPSVLSIAVAECVGPSLAVPVVAPQEDRNPILPQVHSTAMSAIAFSTNCSPATSPDSDALIEPYLKTNREHLSRAVFRVEVSAELPRLPITDCAHDWRGGNGDVVYGLDSVTRCQQPML